MIVGGLEFRRSTLRVEGSKNVESWLDGVLICKYIILSFRNIALKYNTSRRISYVHFNFIARPGNNQQGDLYNGFLFNRNRQLHVPREMPNGLWHDLPSNYSFSHFAPKPVKYD